MIFNMEVDGLKHRDPKGSFLMLYNFFSKHFSTMLIVFIFEYTIINVISNQISENKGTLEVFNFLCRLV
jgi:hypothetical protein